MSWYRAGTAQVTNGSATVLGTGTQWVSKVKIGEAFFGPDGRLYEIDNVSSDTSMTLAKPYAGTTDPAAIYDIIPTQSFMRTLATQVADLIALYQQVPADADAAAASATNALASANEATAQRNLADTARGFAEFARDAAQAAQAAAETAETAAAGSASTASTKATEAAASASDALASKNAASASETAAAGSASTASTKASEAATSATNAATSASEALASKNAAATSATNAATSESNALTSKNAAATSATNAATSESNALASKNAAATSETNAAASASTATTKAGEASTSATNAASSASDAADSAAEAAASAASIAGGPVSSFNTRTGAVTLTKADVTGTGLAKADLSLGNVANTAPADLPISTATQTALDAKAPLASPTLTDTATVTSAAGNAQLILKKNTDSASNVVAGHKGANPQWVMVLGAANAAGDYAVQRYNDAGAYVDTPLLITRSNGQVTVGNLTVSGTLTNTNLTNALNAKFDKSGGTISGGVTINSTTSVNGSLYGTAIHSTGSYGYYIDGSFSDGGNYATRIFETNPNWDTVAFQGYHAPGAWAGCRLVMGTSAPRVIEFRGSGGSSQIICDGVTLTSDRRLKYDLRVIDDALDKVDRLTGYTYFRTDGVDEFHTEPTRHMGLIAQDVEVVAPEAVQDKGDEQHTLSVNYNALSALLVNAIKALRAEVRALRVRVDALEAA